MIEVIFTALIIWAAAVALALAFIAAARQMGDPNA